MATRKNHPHAKASTLKSGQEAIPTRPVPLLPLRGGVLMPGTQIPIPVGRKATRDLVRNLKPGALFAVGVQRDASVLVPTRSDIFDLVTLARVLSVEDGGRVHIAVIEGLKRARIRDIVKTEPHLVVALILSKRFLMAKRPPSPSMASTRSSKISEILSRA